MATDHAVDSRGPLPITLLVLDVDGVLTDGGISISDHGLETKRFHVHDGCGIRIWRRLGGEVAVTQRFELDLLLDGSGPAHFDSGFVLAGAAFPEISVTVSRNAMTCFDQVFTIDAAPQSSAAPPR